MSPSSIKSKVTWGVRFLNSSFWIYLHGFNAVGNTIGAIRYYGNAAAYIDWKWHAFFVVYSVVAGVVLLRERILDRRNL